MIIYEVNLTIAKSIFEDYMTWLIPHVQEMLTFEGFYHARVLSEEQENTDVRKFTGHYEIATRKNLDDYFHHHARRMREEGIQKFSNQFSVTRRIFNISQTLSCSIKNSLQYQEKT